MSYQTWNYNSNKFQSVQELAFEKGSDTKFPCCWWLKQCVLVFLDACKRMFCRIGRTCKISPEGRAECLCGEAGYCNNHRKEVCGSDGLLYPSHCELHRVACLQKKHVGIDHTGKRCSNGTLYSGTCNFYDLCTLTVAFSIGRFSYLFHSNVIWVSSSNEFWTLSKI